ncbi:MAG TPA: nicotinate phosphoribosyltransferase [Myxococcales bacterium]|nr:nicotinate phosphoribosyltransferase [Myxococcales bacterium]
MPGGLYAQPLSLLTDLYQITMAAAAWKAGVDEREAVFHLVFRKAPFHSGFTVAAGLGPALELLRELKLGEDDLRYLAELRAESGEPLFERGFLEHLLALEPRVDIDAVPEGTVVFPQEPLLRVSGPVVACMLLETALLNVINFQTLIATKAARVWLAAQGDPVLEFGLRRAQGPDGGVSAARAAYIGGCAATSNVLAGKLLGIPVRGTHAHSWVMLFDSEREAFDAYAGAMPHNVVLLVDTYDTLQGIRRAIETGKRLRGQGRELAGIRLDSGDLAWLSIEARKMLDAAGFTKTVIYASNELDEDVIASLKQQGARIGAWGVGTRLVTGAEDGALSGVFKLTAVRAGGGEWKPRIKLSDQSAKTSIPGVLQVRRFVVGAEMAGDLIYDPGDGAPGRTLVDMLDVTRRKTIPDGAEVDDLLVPAARDGKVVYASPGLPEMRTRTQAQLARLHPGIKRFVNPHQYPVGLETRLHERRTRMMMEARGA